MASSSDFVAGGHKPLVLHDRAGAFVDLVAALEVGEPFQIFNP